MEDELFLHGTQASIFLDHHFQNLAASSTSDMAEETRLKTCMSREMDGMLSSSTNLLLFCPAWNQGEELIIHCSDPAWTHSPPGSALIPVSGSSSSLISNH